MRLSVVIVSYNVCRLLRQALRSIITAAQDINHEIIVVDNASRDNSVQMIRSEFPNVRLIVNDVNVGFSKGNNQAIKTATGEYILLINPDTITREDTLDKAISFMQSHQSAGGLSVRMIDNEGRFLPESIRGLQSEWVTFFKWTGLYKCFPKSRIFNKFHSGWIEEFETAEVDVLNGAFMLLRKSTLNTTGLLDERFFMYGEDVDLSYRIRKAGYKNYYFPKTYIIHFKGQSTNKFTWQYIKNFYGAMFIFAAKYLFKVPLPSIKRAQELYPASYEFKR